MIVTGTRHAVVTTTLGEVTLVASSHVLTGVHFSDHWSLSQAQGIGVKVATTADPVLSIASRQIHEYLAGTRTSFDLPAMAQGDAFQQRVWALLKTIPYGETVTYRALAAGLGRRDLIRDVGKAVSQNPLAFIIPCHRVVGQDGRLTNYAGGLSRKKMLLDLEGGTWLLRSCRSDLRYLVLQARSPIPTSGR